MEQGALIIRAEQENNALAEQLQALGIPTYQHSMVRVQPCEIPADTRQHWLENLWDGIVLVSPNAVHYFHQQVVSQEKAAWPQAKKQYFSVGPGTGKLILETFNQAVTWPTQAFNSTSLLELAELTQVKGEQWLVINGAPGRPIIPDTLKERGAQVEIASVYERRPKEGKDAHLPEAWWPKINKVILSSHEQANYFCLYLKKQGLLEKAKQLAWIVPSQRIADALLTHSIPERQIHLAKSAMAKDLVETTQKVRATPEKKMPKTPNTPSRKTSLLGRFFILLLFLSVITLALGGGYLWQQQQNIRQQAEAEFDALKNRLSKAQRTDQEFEARLTARLEESAARQLAQQEQLQKQRLQRLQQDQSELQSRLQEHAYLQDQKIAQLSQRVRKGEERSSQSNWQVNEAYARVSAAVQSLKVDQDRDRALLNLTAAHNLLSQESTHFSSITRQLESDIEMLKEYPRVDDSAVLLLLQELQKQAQDLPLKTDKLHKSAQAERSQKAKSSNWRTNLAQAWQDFAADLIKVQKQSELPIRLSLEQKITLISRIELQLQLAQQALVKRNEQVFQSTIQEVLSLLEAYFNTEDIKTKHFKASLTPLESLQIAIEYPSQLLSRAMLKEALEGLDESKSRPQTTELEHHND